MQVNPLKLCAVKSKPTKNAYHQIKNFQIKNHHLRINQSINLSVCLSIYLSI